MCSHGHVQGSDWITMQNGFGATWQASNFGSAPLDVRITDSTGAQHIARYIPSSAPSPWVEGDAECTWQQQARSACRGVTSSGCSSVMAPACWHSPVHHGAAEPSPPLRSGSTPPAFRSAAPLKPVSRLQLPNQVSSCPPGHSLLEAGPCVHLPAARSCQRHAIHHGLTPTT